jgi:hypothetical protein
VVEVNAELESDVKAEEELGGKFEVEKPGESRLDGISVMGAWRSASRDDFLRRSECSCSPSS